MKPFHAIKRAAAVFCMVIALGRSDSIVAAEALLPVVDDNLYAESIRQLNTALIEERDFVKVHAAEALLGLGFDDNVQKVFTEEAKTHGDEPHYRIGIWRVLVRSNKDAAIRGGYLKKLRDISLDPTDPDRITATESLAKLKYRITSEDRPRFQAYSQNPTAGGVHFYRWLLAEGNDQDLPLLAELLDSSNAEVRGITAYALRHLANRLPPDIVAKLAATADNEPESRYRVHLIVAAYVAARDDHQAEQFKERLLPYARSSSKDEKYQVAAALAVRGAGDDLPLLSELLKDPDTDVRVSAANAILRIDRRKPLPFEIVDWLVLAGYAVSMLAVGWNFSRRTSSTDDYLLARRSMSAWSVGLSYFATLFSTITYLAIPGEMIQYGPMILSQIIAFPVIYLIAGYVLIPFIMRLKITSAYEILEKRFDVSVRILGSFLFLALRLIWMAFIIFATSQHVLAPLLRLEPSATPWLALAIGVLTVTYTSMGGLRAVIWTDVAQTFILIFGAILSIVLISIRLGGPIAWWPTAWSPEWSSPTFGLDPTARVTMATAALSAFVWYLCTAGSDQIAIQRYLATRDAASARRMFGISLACNAFVWLLLAILGLALLTYFQSNPRLLPDGETLESGADQLLPQYIVKGLPAGISGLIVAGLLAAAMSSLSSGLSSGCSVITVDWIDRLRTKRIADKDRLRLARRISWLIGLVVVLLSFSATIVQGNLLERGNKLVNLFTAPLFVLFFMAMFVPWATTFGTWAAAAASVTIAVAISQFDFLGLSFLWIMPASLAAGILTGCLASLVPVGQRRPMLEFE